MRHIAVLFGLAAMLIGTAGPVLASDRVTVFAASSLTDVLGAVEAAFEAETGADLRLSFAASSVLAHQIERGAPADIYVSANAEWVDYLLDRGLTSPAHTTVLARNTLMLIAPKTAATHDHAGLAEFDFAAWVGSDGRLAIADPDHVPAGRYARQALKTLERWEAISDRLAIANNVRAALLLVERGEAPLGIVYRTDAIASDAVIQLAALPPRTHDPILYRAARLGKAPSLPVRTFWTYLQGPRAAAIFREFGFAPAGD
ncbi:MAG: molybdate ABC transporter substrate-binding protein [Pseudomonadota bacterium]